MKKKLKIKYNSPVSLSFVILCFGVTIAGIITNGYITETFFSVYRGSLDDILSIIRLISHVIGHVGMNHFMSNAMYILLLGPMLEEKHGSKVMFGVIIFTAIATGIIHCLLWENIILCGASGIVFAYIVLSSFTAFKEGEIPLTFILVVTLFIGTEVYTGIIMQDNISNISHIIGGVTGAIVGYTFNMNKM